MSEDQEMDKSIDEKTTDDLTIELTMNDSLNESTDDVVLEASTEESTEVETIEEEDLEEEFIPIEQLESIIESLLFVSDRPLSLAAIKQVFKSTTVSTRQIKNALDAVAIEFASANRGVSLEEVSGGYRLHTKVDNMSYLKKLTKVRPFRLSGPALEVMAIVAYKQPIIKAEVDEIRGVESGHLLRAIMDKGLVSFAGKSELPGKPMLYGTTRKFMEIFSLKSLKDLPALSEIDELLPDGIGGEEEEEVEKPTLDTLTSSLSTEIDENFSQGEAELLKISDKLSSINTSSDFFEQEKQRQKDKRENDRARDIREALDVGEEVSTRDKNWLERRLANISAKAVEAEVVEVVGEEVAVAEIVSEGETSEESEVDAEISVEMRAPDIEVETEMDTEAEQDIPAIGIDPDDEVRSMQAQDAIRAFEDDDSENILSADGVPSLTAVEQPADGAGEPEGQPTDQ